jgi:hypothetical protein
MKIFTLLYGLAIASVALCAHADEKKTVVELPPTYIHAAAPSYIDPQSDVKKSEVKSSESR